MPRGFESASQPLARRAILGLAVLFGAFVSPCPALAQDESPDGQVSEDSPFAPDTRPDAAIGGGAVSGNPGASNILIGSGWIGDTLGINRRGWRFSGLNFTDANGQFTGGSDPGKWTGDSLTIAGVSIDLEEFVGWKDTIVATNFLYYSGGSVNQNAGTVMGYNSLDGRQPPTTRAQLFEMWVYKRFFDRKLGIRIGRCIPTYDFNNVVSPVPVDDPSLSIPVVSSAIIKPLYVSPTVLGIMPGYYNSTTGLCVDFEPNQHLYVKYGLYDGNLARGRNLSMEGPHFNGYMLHVAETGGAWIIGEQHKPGNLGIGYWRQTGELDTHRGPVRGAEGCYFYLSQRLYFERPGESADGLSGYIQLAATNSEFAKTHRFVGFGLTYFGPWRGRDGDSMGFAFAYGRMNNDPLLDIGNDEFIYSWYYQYQITKNIYFQPNLTYIADPAERPDLNDVIALTLRGIILF